jgi:hypothetical protein
MQVVWGLVLLGGFYPLCRAWRANRRTTLRPALAWAGCAWAAWVLAAWGGDGELARYLALCLSGCAGVAVLGARRPGVAAWNFVVAGLLAVLLLPAARGLGTVRLEGAHLLFLGATLAVPLLNYLPTRLGPSALALGVASGLELARLCGLEIDEGLRSAGRCLLALAPWLALAGLLRSGAGNAVDDVWRGFRDGFGLLWGLRQREQFNRAAQNAGWAVRLSWGGLRARPEGTPPGEGQALALLRGVLKRFGPEEGEAAP